MPNIKKALGSSITCSDMDWICQQQSELVLDSYTWFMLGSLGASHMIMVTRDELVPPNSLFKPNPRRG